MSRLIVISNRVQQLASGSSGNQGGLAVALLAALRQHGGVWFGWSGETTDTFTGEISYQSEGRATTAVLWGLPDARRVTRDQVLTFGVDLDDEEPHDADDDLW